MRRCSSFLKGAAGLLAVVGLALPAAAQSKIGYSTVDIGIFGGPQFFQLYQNPSARTITYDEGGLFGVRVTEDLWEHWGVEESAGYGRNNLRAKVLGLPNVSVFGIGGRTYDVDLNAIYYFQRREAKLRFFLTAGPGVTWYRGEHSAIEAPSNTPEFMNMKYGPALNYGVGLKMNFWRRVGLRVDVRDNLTKSPHYGFPSYSTAPGTVYLPNGGTEHALSATLGITFHARVHDDAAPVVEAPKPQPKPEAPKAEPKAPVTIDAGNISGAHDVCPGKVCSLAPTPMSPAQLLPING